MPFRMSWSANTDTLAGGIRAVYRWLLVVLLVGDLRQADEETILVDDVATHERRDQASGLLHVLRRAQALQAIIMSERLPIGLISA